MGWFMYLVHSFPHERSVSVSEQENYLIMVIAIIHLNLFIIKYGKRRCIAPIASKVGKTRKETAFHILRNATSETNIESNAFSHTRKESRNYW